MIAIWILLFVFMHLCLVESQLFDQNALESKIFEKYNRKVRPVKSPKNKTDITMAIYVRHIESVDEMQQTIRFHGIIFVSWKDYYLTWNANDYNSTISININPWKIWQPDIALFNSATGTDFTFNYWKYPVWLTNSGQVAEWQDFSFTVTCKFDFYYFPKDTQVCTATLGSWMYDLTEIDWIWEENLMVKTKMSWYSDKEKRHSNGWELINATGSKAFWGPGGVLNELPDDATTKYYWPMMLIRIEVQRHRPYFYVTEVLPLILIGLLTLCSFWIETESAVMSILLVNLLSQGVLSWGLLNQLPPAAGNLPRMVIIYGINFGLTCVALFAHIIINCVKTWKVQLPAFAGNLSARTKNWKALNTRGVSFYRTTFDDDDDKEQFLDDEPNETHDAPIAPATNELDVLLFLIRRILFFIFLIFYVAMFITILV